MIITDLNTANAVISSVAAYIAANAELLNASRALDWDEADNWDDLRLSVDAAESSALDQMRTVDAATFIAAAIQAEERGLAELRYVDLVRRNCTDVKDEIVTSIACFESFGAEARRNLEAPLYLHDEVNRIGALQAVDAIVERVEMMVALKARAALRSSSR